MESDVSYQSCEPTHARTHLKQLVENFKITRNNVCTFFCRTLQMEKALEGT